MPCGGIYPIRDHSMQLMFSATNPEHTCWTCHQPVVADVDLFVAEEDAFLHRAADCFLHYLTSAEGREMLSHGHAILIPELPRPGVVATQVLQ